MSSVKWETFTCKNTKSEDKPNEDYAFFDQELNVGMLFDGVSRDKENGKYPVPSPSAIATKIFAHSILRSSKNYSDIGLGELQNIISCANKEVQIYNGQLNHRFPAGTVGIVFCINKSMLHYAYIGDSYAAIIRGDNRRVLTECQTAEVIKHKREYTSDEIRFDICNHISHPCGYGVWDGNPNAMDFVKYGSIKLHLGDVILLYSDGLCDEISSKSNSEIVRENVNDLFSDCPENGSDDRTCLKICIC